MILKLLSLLKSAVDLFSILWNVYYLILTMISSDELAYAKIINNHAVFKYTNALVCIDTQ